jgi:hypothetical protein
MMPLEASGSSSKAVIVASVKPTAMISPPYNECVWELDIKEPGTKTKEIALMIKANCPWKLIAKDLSGICDGYMIEWTGSGYGSKRLSQPVRISAVEDVVLSDGKSEPIFTGDKTGFQGRIVTMTLSQTIDECDLPLPPDKVYRISVAFEAIPV